MNASAAFSSASGTAIIPGGVKARCPRCGCTMETPMQLCDPVVESLECMRCGSVWYAIEGIWRAITPERASQLGASLSAYEAVREAEGRWSPDPEFYRSLPWRDTTGNFQDQWGIRARSFNFARGRILPELTRRLGRQRLRVLDLGAGNCWLSYRLALLGHDPIAVDLGVGRKDGLGAATHFKGILGQMFPRLQAEMDRLPFANDQFDLAIYNASFHYARNYDATLREAVRVLRPDGAVLIVDSPTYRNEADGEAMKREKEIAFTRSFGTDLGGMGGQEYLTPERLARLEQIGIRWRRYSPWYGWRWALRPMIARLKGRRRPSRFHIYLGTLAGSTAEAK